MIDSLDFIDDPQNFINICAFDKSNESVHVFNKYNIPDPLKRFQGQHVDGLSLIFGVLTLFASN